MIIVELEFKQTHQLTFMFVIGQQKLFQSAGLYFIPFYLKIVDLFWDVQLFYISFLVRVNAKIYFMNGW